MRTRTVLSCSICGNKYSKREHYERHVRVHTREKPFACPQCTAAFSRRDTLRRHIRSLHPDVQDVSRTTDNVALSVSHDTATRTQACAQLPTANVEPLNYDAGLGCAPTPSFPDVLVQFASETFDWQWDSALNLDPSFLMGDLGICEPDVGRPGTPACLSRSSVPETLAISPQPGSFPEQLLETQNSDAHNLSPAAGGVGASQSGVDEAARDMLAKSLWQRVPDTILPSTGFLNRCIYLYTTHVWPLIPVVHLPTFQPAQVHPLLVLNICAIGALAEGSPSAYHHAVRLFEGVRKAILVSISMEPRGSHQTLAVLQASVIGQTCVILSGQTTHIRTARLFHGTLAISMQEYYNSVVKSWNSSPVDSCTPGQDSEAPLDWQRWIKEQTLLRLCSAVQIHNGEIAATVNQPAQLRTQICPQAAEPDTLYLAKTADEWRTLRSCFASANGQPVAMLSSCAELAHTAAEISHSKLASSDDGRTKDVSTITSSLIKWLEKQRGLLSPERKHRLSPMMLWHSCFLMISCDFELIERSCTPLGQDPAVLRRPASLALSSPSLKDWACSKDACTAALHAIFIFKLLEDFRVSEAPSIHVARCAWQAGLVLAVYSLSTSDQGDAIASWSGDLQDHPELLLAHQVGVLTERNWNSISQPISAAQSRNMAYQLCTILRHLGPWGNAAWFSNKLAEVLDTIDN
ncbi:early growth response [Fusarium mundagurra]|uniref:Early growth response n=1 Tax=Fusarium mundagurra TaxID=1567541 RepID=A0A8H5XMY0_9HYPO|nr:early growth response [Fusarium mundagurra]